MQPYSFDEFILLCEVESFIISSGGATVAEVAKRFNISEDEATMLVVKLLKDGRIWTKF